MNSEVYAKLRTQKKSEELNNVPIVPITKEKKKDLLDIIQLMPFVGVLIVHFHKRLPVEIGSNQESVISKTIVIAEKQFGGNCYARK